MIIAKSGDTVKVHYTGKLNDGEIFDSSVNKEPLTFTIGGNQVIPGFENGVIGMKTGDSKTINIPYADAYGEYSESMVVEIPKSRLPEGMNPQLGDQFTLNQQGYDFVVTVIIVKEDSIVLDANHPLSGKDLVFDVQLVEIV